ncbi:hypothetical protein BX666DRAFT_1915476 [Dichotomocladium elegans]|nr:hypothetical protein BX666DRAFT_1915476 [Dichotomocladium elegans]
MTWASMPSEFLERYQESSASSSSTSSSASSMIAGHYHYQHSHGAAGTGVPPPLLAWGHPGDPLHKEHYHPLHQHHPHALPSPFPPTEGPYRSGNTTPYGFPPTSAVSDHQGHISQPTAGMIHPLSQVSGDGSKPAQHSQQNNGSYFTYYPAMPTPPIHQGQSHPLPPPPHHPHYYYQHPHAGKLPLPTPAEGGLPPPTAAGAIPGQYATVAAATAAASLQPPRSNNKRKKARMELDEDDMSNAVEPGDPDFPDMSLKDIEAARVDIEARPRRQKLRYPGDKYTPKWVRYNGQAKEGLCDTCQPGKWLQLKNSAFWYHKQFFHGISSVSGQEFMQPLETRWIDQDLVEGLCHQCCQWVSVSNVKRKNSVLWYRHAHKCHVYHKPKANATKRR